MLANTPPLARGLWIGVLGIALLDPGLLRAQSHSDSSRSGRASQSVLTTASSDDAADKTFAFYGKSDAVRQANAQGRDALLNGAAIGAAVGAGIGVAVTHGVRDSDLVFAQYARGALLFAAIGAGAGLGIDALFSHVSPGPTVTPRRVVIAPVVWPDFAGVAVTWRW